MNTPLDRISVDDFAGLAGQSLPAEAGEHCFEFRVESAQASPHPSGRALPGFSLYLRGPAGMRLGQGVYALEHPRHGRLQLFMTPIRVDADALIYEAVFN